MMIAITIYRAFLEFFTSVFPTRNTSNGDTSHVLNNGNNANNTDINNPSSTPVIKGCTDIRIVTSNGKNS